MQITLAQARDLDGVAALVVLERDVKWLVDISDPVSEALEEPELVVDVDAEGKIARVIQNGGSDAAVGERAEMRRIHGIIGAADVEVMLRLALTRKPVRPCASVGKGAELGIDRDQSIDTGFDLRLQLLVRDLADDAVPEIAPGKSEGRIESREEKRCQENQLPHQNRLIVTVAMGGTSS